MVVWRLEPNASIRCVQNVRMSGNTGISFRLEQRLSQRRARVADLKQQKDKALQEAKNGKEKDKVKLAEQLVGTV